MAEIYYEDTVRFKTTVDGATKYVTLAVVPPSETCWLTLTDEPTEDSNFLIREWNYDNTSRLYFSGNLRADTPDSHGNFRLLHRDTRPPDHNVGDDYCVSMAMYEPGANMGYWGISWDAAYDLETFALFATAWPDSDGGVCSGNSVKIRSLIGSKKPPPVGSIGQFLTINNINGQWRITGISDHATYPVGAEFVIEKVV
ncbi:uncharacterized protein BHQ10_000556 [Talaromyces amestolkiae]|uniref:Uncharacterized protein n=1 Tax=Talaromyces amestolkiae TaxID=1196081 RepID=A0A364KLW8_TALAM|nr:uncharacterized protein BHQ10_000556 [Talaromyces amestolkiae]RAO64544.1 hypothetical protein BHQ10_000556 [Talaromyces amestolkiae]